jgi:uncharacterized membrane protein
MKVTWRSELASWLILVYMFVLAAITWSWAPERIPVHWNMSMHVDRYGGKFEGLLLPPLLAVVFYVLFLLLPRIDPGRANYAGFWGAFTTLRICIVAFLGAIYSVMHLWIRGVHVDMAAAVPVLMGALFVVVGNLLGKVRPNWFVGIRTPWTLSSKTSWTRTHQVGGWVFVLGGIAFMIAGLVRRPWAMMSAGIMFGAGLVAIIVYSFFVWREDPDKVPPAGTLPV